MTDTDTKSPKRNLIVSEFLSLDGVMEAPDEWSLEFFSEEKEEYKQDELFAADALLLGRRTYEGFATAWPDREDDAGFADRMNSLPKYVVSTSLGEAGWNSSTIIDSNVPEAVAELKQEEGEDILVNGSGEPVDTLAEHDLVDEYRLMVHPVVQGSGKRLFEGVDEPATLSLVDTETFSSGSSCSPTNPRRRRQSND